MPSSAKVMFEQNSSHIPIAKCLPLRICQVNEVQFRTSGDYRRVTLPAAFNDAGENRVRATRL